MTPLISKNFSPVFVEHMQNAMLTSASKYGDMRGGDGKIHPAILEEDMIESIRYRLKRWVETGRTEFLVDIANYAMIEFVKYGEQYTAQDSEGCAHESHAS